MTRQTKLYASYTRPILRSHPAGRRRHWGLWVTLLIGLLLFVPLLAGLVYFLFPLPVQLLVMGIDARPGEADYGRTDTLILVSIKPLHPSIRMLSIPRDLWVTIPGHGENRINTAHFYGELESPGSGPQLALETVGQNFGIRPNYYVRVRFEGVTQVVDAMGGLDLDLDQPAAGLPAGKSHLAGEQVLAFVRSRSAGDDFFRMDDTRVVIQAMVRQMMKPGTWRHLPEILGALSEFVDTNLPLWQMPRVSLAFMRAASQIDSRAIDRSMVTPTVTAGGADVLMPDWDKINPLIKEMYGN